MKSQVTKSHSILPNGPLPSALRRSTLVLGVALAATLLAGCGHSSHVGDHGDPAQPAYFVELEPNDSPDFPDFVGVLDRFSWLQVEGSVQAVGFDIVDHIEFEAAEPIEIDFTVEAFGAFGDVDVFIYDPIDGVIVGSYAIGGRFESGTIIVHEPGRPFQFIIEAFDTDSPWLLTLEAYPHDCNCYGASNELPGAGGNVDGLESEPEERPAPIVLKRLPGEIRTRAEQSPANENGRI